MATAWVRRAIMGLAIGGSLVLAACGRGAGIAPTPTALPALHPAAALVVAHPIPPMDLEAAGLRGVADLVTPFQISSTDHDRTLTLIGAYADVARTVLLIRESPDIGLPDVRVTDDQGMVNSGGSSGPIHAPGIRGDYYVALDEGVHSGADGLAHLAIAISYLRTWDPKSEIVEGSWAFTVALTVQPGQALAAPTQFRLGAWKVTVEILQLTPAVVRLQTVVNGASPVALEGPGIGAFAELIDAAGNPVRSLGGGAGITVPKLQVNPVNYQNSRTRDEWQRPAAGTYRLRFHGGGGRFEIPIVIGS